MTVHEVTGSLRIRLSSGLLIRRFLARQRKAQRLNDLQTRQIDRA